MAADESIQLIAWFKERITLPDFDVSMWFSDAHDHTVLEFCQNPSVRRIIATYSEGQLLLHSKECSPVVARAKILVYFLKPAGVQVAMGSIADLVQYGMVSGAGMFTLLRLMSGVYAPQIFENNTAWPESIKKDFTGHFHKFMASLTETANESQGKTVLYLPSSLTSFDLEGVASVAKNKDVVQQLESVVIQWTRQIKQVVNNHDNAYNAEVSGPLEEIVFWRSRTVDLSGISSQLQREDVHKVVAILAAAKSSYLARFETLSQRIQEGSVEANNNLKFLESITPQCEALSQAEPKEIPAILPTLLNCIRMIWSLSRFYNSEERLTGLLRKISNEIIHRCRAKISLDDIFDGDVDASILTLEESIACGVSWKLIYKRTAAAVAASSSLRWAFDDASIFAQIEAFVQRCRDLLEVCEGQIQFVRKSSVTKGAPGPLPRFGGSRGQEITKQLLTVQENFEVQIERLRQIQTNDYEILDVKTSKWHDDYNFFKNQVKDLEVMYTNVMNTAFDGTSHVKDGVALLETFYMLAKRDAIRQCVEKKTAEIYLLFQRQVQGVRNEFDKKQMCLRPNEPQYAGSALWARSLGLMVEESWSLLQGAKYLVHPKEAKDAEGAYNGLITVLNDYKTNRYQTWKEDINALGQGSLQGRLDTPLMRRASSEGESAQRTLALLECNFDENILALFTEVHYWEKFQGEFGIPYTAHDLCNQRDKLRIMREQVMLAVRAYNAIIVDLSPEERRLFTDHIRRLDKRINQGLTKLTWAAKGAVEIYVRDCCAHASDVHVVIKTFKTGKQTIGNTCRWIANLMLLKIDKNTVYDEAEFGAKQADHRDYVKKCFKDRHIVIKDMMKSMYAHFKEGSLEVRREWRALVTQIDRNVEVALRQTVKRSLQELSRAINGDAKTEPQLLFRVNIVLEQGRVDYNPTMINLTHVVNIVAKELISTVAVVPRLREVLAAEIEMDGGGAGGDGKMEDKADKFPTFYSVIYDDVDMLKIVVLIMNGMSATATELQKYLSYWDKHKPVWELDKESFIRRYAKANRTLKNYDTDVTKYREQQNEIQTEPITHTINFIQIDCTRLKTALSNHCLQWQAKLLELLNSNAQRELFRLHEKFNATKEFFDKPPADLDQLSESINKLKSLQQELPSIEDSFLPLEEKYQTLAKFDKQVTDEEAQKLASLQDRWTNFNEMLGETAKALDNAKVNMRRDLESNLDSFTNSASELRASSTKELPYASECSIPVAFTVLEEYQRKIESLRSRQTSLKPNCDIFGMEVPDPKELKETEIELEALDAIWVLTKEWTGAWDAWKTGTFQSLDVVEMESIANEYFKRLKKMLRKSKWPILDTMKSRLQQFLDTMPLITDLKNPAMRPRHWAELQEEVGKVFDPNEASFTLEKVFSLGLHAHGDMIGEMSANANKELNIEQGLIAIEERWKDIDVDITSYKDTYYKIRSTEDLFQSLEDDAVVVSTQKSSKFYGAFKEQIDYWDSTLSLMSEVVEVLLTVQRKWMYLESIFMAGGDIVKQLPKESVLFGSVNDTFKQIMSRIANDPNAQRSCKVENMLQIVTDMDEKLEQIQKSLNQYLETKRMAFPRFYFVPDDDLLEILGQSRDPLAVQKHIKKCFEGFAQMHVIPAGKQLNRVPQCSGMVAPDGETAAFVANVDLDGAVELWLGALEQAMQLGMAKLLQISLQLFKGKKEKWVKEIQGQLLIATGAIQWTSDCTKSLMAVQGGNKSAMKQLKKKQLSYIARLTDMIRGNLTSIERNKVVSLITMEIHNRDVMIRMIQANCASVTDFEWTKQLRFIYNKDEGQFGTCIVKQTNCVLEYSYEYQGNNGRLVVTELTDRCVLTLLTAMFLHRGGNPLGPAGTGKTETVKDLGKNLAKFVVVTNCSDAMDYKSCGRLFSGLVQSGAWGCFDEFNRIKIEVISVVAMQVLAITDALSKQQSQMPFMGQTIQVNRNCGLFITMNPGYAGRTELPDNLKALMRPVAMMVPNLAMIAEVILASESFNEAKSLAKKTITLYELMQQQLSKQDHYDYGLRNLKAVLSMAGSLKRSDPTMNEEVILMSALRDMNLPKFIKDDERLFRLLLGDLFPSIELPVSDLGAMQRAIERELGRAGFQLHPFIMFKIGQLYDSKATRHCNMLVGRTMAGKSVCWKTLMKAKSAMAKEDKVEGAQPVVRHVINSKSISLTELYGAYDLQTFEWENGILSTLFKACSESEKPDEKWIMFDGPVDALWVESMNSVMDDSRLLTLINGDRIPLTKPMSLLFEVEDLVVASPATVSRAGMIYLDVTEMGFDPFVETWLAELFVDDADALKLHRELFDKYVKKILAFKELNCTEPVPMDDFNAVKSFTALYTSLATQENGVDRSDAAYNVMVEKWFVFALLWSIMAAVDDAGRTKLDVFIRDIEAQFPPMNSVYDYFVDPKKKDWELWETKIPNWRPQRGMQFHKMIVPTADTVRNGFVLDSLVMNNIHALVVGETGTGKTVLAQSQLSNLPEMYHSLVMNFSAATRSDTTQNIIEAAMEKRPGGKMGPVGGKQLVVLIDDFNMPKKISAESPSQPPLELLRLWMDYTGWYDRKKCAWRGIEDMQLIAAMAPPSGGRAVISGRTQSRFHMLNCTSPDNAALTRIFESILTPKLNEFDNDVKSLGKTLAQATLAVFVEVDRDFLPTPEKFHYLFNVRDVSKVVQGVLQGEKVYFDGKDDICRLWAHENLRVYADRFTDQAADSSKFLSILSSKMKEFLGEDWNSIMQETPDPQQGPVICSFMQETNDDGPFPYQEVTDMLKLRAVLDEKLEDYNAEPKLLSMNLVLFDDACRHICRIVRVLKLSRGNMMLVGVGGSGRQSLARLSSFICEYNVFTIKITNNYRVVEFHEDLKTLFRLAGMEGKATTFLFNDTQVKDETFLEDINNILSSGEVPNLFQKDELPEIFDGLRKPAEVAGVEEVPDQLWEFFIERVRSNLHIVLAMSYVGPALRERCRYYPGFVNCTTIDWFHAWPSEALTSVALKFLADVPLESDEMRAEVAGVFATIHMSSQLASIRMAAELKRYNYITPTQYLELVRGYKTLLAEKSSELGDAAAKLGNGLTKLEESREQVEVMSVELEKKKVIVAQAVKDCENLLVEIVSERRDADEKKKQVEADQQKIAKEEAECNAKAEVAQSQLNVAMPALEKALAEVDKLDKGAITEVKGFTSAPSGVEKTMSAVMLLFKKPTDWATAKKTMGDASSFLKAVKSYDKDGITDALQKKLAKYVNDPEMSPEFVLKQSRAGGALCIWVHAMYTYSTVFRNVAPLREALKQAQTLLAAKQKELKIQEEALAVVIAKVNALGVQLDTATADKNRLRQESEDLEAKLDRAEKLVKGLSGEYTRWQASIGAFKAAITDAIGDALLSSGVLSYLGPFDTSYRERIILEWTTDLKARQLPITESYSFASFLAVPTDVRDWNIQGLPADLFSTENGVIVTRSHRWPLMIDPQGQANKWIRKLENEQLKIVDLKMKDMLRVVENAIQYGAPVLLQDILTELDPSLEPVLAKEIIKLGNRRVLRLGDKELDYSDDFRLYITTKLGNPHYMPEVATKAAIVNFSVKQQGLEAQLLGIVVQMEQPSLEQQKSELVMRVAAGKRKLVDLENEILSLLSKSEGSLLDDEVLVGTLQQSKVTSEEVTQQLQVAEENEIKIDAAREGYRSAAIRSAIAYFVLNDMSRVNAMYQFSLEAYVALFSQSIDRSRDASTSAHMPVSERCKQINSYHTLAVYNYTCLGLFERHKLLFSLQLCVRIMERDSKIPKADFEFFCYGGVVIDRSDQRLNPCPDWIDEPTWDNFTELDKLPAFMGIASALEQGQRDWKNWYLSAKPEEEQLPGDWDNKCSELQRMCILRSLRKDRVLFAANQFVSNNLGREFADPPPFDLGNVYATSTAFTPLVFILSPGVDPTAQVMGLAESLGRSFFNCALGQGQGPEAERLVREGVVHGTWVLLANCHLMISWLSVLEKIITEYCESEPNASFRLWLSSSPSPEFPIAILQRSIKMTTEPPRGLRANMLKLYNLVSEEKFAECGMQFKYKKLLFSLAWFHAILLERRKFKSLGFNIPYEFNESDFAICHDIIVVFLDDYPDKTPIDAMRNLIADANYGGRITDDWDRRLVSVYINQFVCDEAITVDQYPLADLPTYSIPGDGDLESYKIAVRALPQDDHPLAFGQHPNADISSKMEDTKTLLGTIISLQPKAATEGEETNEVKVIRRVDTLKEQVPQIFNMRSTRKTMETRSDPDPLKTVLFQECDRYNKLLSTIHRALRDLELATQGLVVITPALEDVMESLLDFRVPEAWAFAYPSLKPLSSWTRDLLARCTTFTTWINVALPKVFWIPAFTYPTGYLTALLQTSARKNGIAIDTLNYEHPILTQEPQTISAAAKEGSYVYGLFVEGARWDSDTNALAEPVPMELYAQMPVVHFKPVENKKKGAKGQYNCPVYLYPFRSGSRERPSFVTECDVKAGSSPAEFWIKRGVALLLAIGT